MPNGLDQDISSDEIQKMQTEILQLRQDLNALQRDSITWEFFSRPAIMLGLALAAAALFCGWIILRFEGEKQWYYLYYFAPISVPFVCFLLERADTLRNKTAWPYLIDLPVLVLSLIRAFYPLPFISGHAYFLSYALLTTRNWPARLTAALVLLEVIILKVFVWHDATLLGGMAAATFSALLLLLFRRKS
jgi:hypothetical protein